MIVAASSSRHAAVILPGVYGVSPPPFATKRLVIYAAALVNVTIGQTTDRYPATVIECKDASVAEPFAALVGHVFTLFEREPALSWSDVCRVITQWSALFSAGRLLDEDESLGLWGELWVLARTTKPDKMIKAWRGVEAGTADFVLQEGILEVKTSTRPFVHHVSHGQTLMSDNAFLLSLSTADGPGGETLSSLAEQIRMRIADPGDFYGALARLGCSLETLSSSRRARVLLASPALFHIRDIPTIRAVDAGITNLRYTVALDPTRAASGAVLATATDAFGLQPGMVSCD